MNKPKVKTRKLTRYEKKQIKPIKKWKEERPGVIGKNLGIVVEPAAWLVRRIIPESATKAAIDAASKAGEKLADKKDIIRDGHVRNISSLKRKNLELSDEIANDVHNWAIGMAVVEGAVTGLEGILLAPIDITLIITLAFRTIHKIGLCYGYECVDKNDRDFVLGILAASGANTLEEKLAALTALRIIEVQIAKKTWKDLARRAAQQQLGKEAAIIGAKQLAKQLGINLTKREALAAIPVIGALIGGSVNGWYIKEVGWLARRSFQERWLLDNHKIIEI